MGDDDHQGFDDAAFIAANDPDRTVRDCAEDLDVLTRHADHEGRCVTCMEWCECDDTALVGDCPCRDNEPHPCPELRSLARRYQIPVDGA